MDLGAAHGGPPHRRLVATELAATELAATELAARPTRRLFTPDLIALRPAREEDWPFLYRLLRERYAHEHSNIAGMATAGLPSFEEHCAHLRTGPYRRMEIVVADREDAGLMYLTHESVGGCFILDEFAGRGLALSACYSFFRGERFPITAHFNTANRAGWRTADRLGWTLVRREEHRLTYELRNEPLDPFKHLRDRLGEA